MLSMKTTRKVMAMNNPFRSLESEMQFIKECGADGMELSIEPPEAYLAEAMAHVNQLKEFCSIGHTRYDLQFGSPNDSIRSNALKKFEQALDVFEKIGITIVNFHPHSDESDTPRTVVHQKNIESLKTACQMGKKRGITIMIENQKPFPLAEEYDEIFEQVPEAMLLLDIAHAIYLGGMQNVENFIKNHSSKIAHIHLCDNRGKSDDHLYLGKGTIDLRTILPMIVENTNDSVNFTLEPFMVDDDLDGLRLASQNERRELLRESIQLVRNIIN